MGDGEAGVKGCLRIVIPIVVLIALATYCAFPRPTHDQAQLRAIAAESQRLMVAYPIRLSGQGINVPKEKWPPAIAGLKPASVTVRHGMVEITTKPFFDGGWGYGFAIDKHDLTMSAECWSELEHGVYWHGPC